MMRNERGFTVLEVAIAASIIMLAFAAVAFGMNFATRGSEVGKQQTTALFLAEQRLEAVKSQALANFANVTNAAFPNDAYGAIAGQPNYRRTVTIVNNPAGIANTKLVQVSVFYRPITQQGVDAERNVTLSTVVASR